MSKTIGSYEITEPLDGPGEVHLARRGAERVMLRMIPGAADDELVTQARKESTVCASLGHEAIAAVEEIIVENGQIAIASAAPPRGARLSALLDRLSPEGVWVVAYEVAGALALAHAAADDDGDFFHVCHGHLSPEVIHLGAGGEVRLEGLGLAPLVGAVITAPPAFTAPEQRGGGRVTPRGDIYALACVIYALLRGHEPSPAPSPRDIADKVPPSFREAFSLALEGKVSSRRITALELEQWLSDLVTDAGRQALAAAVRPPKASRPVHEGNALLGRAKGKAPPLRSKQATILGRPKPPPPRKKLQSAPPLNWDDLEEAAKRPSVPPGLGDIDSSWDEAWDDEKTTIAARPTSEEIERALAAAPPDRARPARDEGAGRAAVPPSAREPEGASEVAAASRSFDDEATVIAGRPEIPSPTTEDEATVIAHRSGLDDAPVSQSEVDTHERPRPAALQAKLVRPPALPSSPAPPRASDRGMPQGSGPGGPPRASDRALPARAADAWADDDAGVPEELAGATVGAPSTQRMRDAKPPDVDDELMATVAVDEPPVMSAEVDESDRELTLPTDDEAEGPAPASARSGPSVEPIAAAPSAAGLPPELPPTARAHAPPPASSPAIPPTLPAVASAAPASPGPSAAERATSSADSPWSSETRPTSRASNEPISLLTSVLIMIGTAAVVMGVGIWWARRNATVTIPEAPPVATTAAPPATDSPPRRAIAPTAQPTAQPTVEPAPEKDPTALPPTKGYLRVRFSGQPDARVFLKSQEAGGVGELLEVPCGFQYINIGTPQKVWLAKEPRSFKVECQKINEIEMK
jgi:serine/threonine protein kinase